MPERPSSRVVSDTDIITLLLNHAENTIKILANLQPKVGQCNFLCAIRIMNEQKDPNNETWHLV
ncbi:hypothetical protein PPNK14_21480 [Pectobacterium parmentieri]